MRGQGKLAKTVLALCLTLALATPALDAIASRPKVEPPPRHYEPPTRVYTEEGFDAVWLLRSDHAIFEGTYTLHRVHRKLRILTERGAERFLEVKIRYNRHWEELEVEYIRTILPDGTELAPMPDAIHDVPLVRERVYSDARLRVYHMPGVGAGSIIEYSYTLKEKFPVPGKFQDWSVFQDWMPIREVNYNLTVPDEYMMYLDWDVLLTNGIEELPLTFTTEGNTYLWRCQNVPGILPEFWMPTLEEVAPAILISSFDSWEEIGDWWQGLMAEVLEPSTEIEKKVSELIKGKATREERIAAIYHWVIQNTRYVALEFGIGGFKPYPADTVFQNGYGDCKDGMALLLSMLKVAGIEAYPALINATGDVRPELPILWFDHAIAAIPSEEKKFGSSWLFLDTTASTNTFGDLPISDQAKWTLIVGLNGGTEHELAQSPLYPPDWNRWRISQEMHLLQDGEVTNTVRWETSGFFSMLWRYIFRSLTEPQMLYFFKSYASLLIPGAELKWYNVSELEEYDKPVELTMLLVGKGAQFYSPESMALNIPMTVGPFRGLVKLAWRYYPFVVGVPCVIEQVTTVSLPLGWEVEALGEDLLIDSYWGAILIESATIGRPLLMNRVVEVVNQKRIPRRMYNEFVEAQNEYTRHLELPVLLKKVKTP